MKKFIYALLLSIPIFFLGSPVKAFELTEYDFESDSSFDMGINGNVFQYFKKGALGSFTRHDFDFTEFSYTDYNGFSFTHVYHYFLSTDSSGAVYSHFIFREAYIDSGYTESNPDSEGNYNYDNVYLLSDYIDLDSLSFVLSPVYSVSNIQLVPLVNFKFLDNVSWTNLTGKEHLAILGMLGYQPINIPSLQLEIQYYPIYYNNSYSSGCFGYNPFTSKDFTSSLFYNYNQNFYGTLSSSEFTNSYYAKFGYRYFYSFVYNYDDNTFVRSGPSSLGSLGYWSSSNVSYFSSNYSRYSDSVNLTGLFVGSTLPVNYWYTYGLAIEPSNSITYGSQFNSDSITSSLNFDFSDFISPINFIVLNVSNFFNGLPSIVKSCLMLVFSLSIVGAVIKLLL